VNVLLAYFLFISTLAPNSFSYSPVSVSMPNPRGYRSGERGEITRRVSGCDYFVVETRSGYDVLEWYGGHDPDKGDTLTGNYNGYGFHDVVDETADETLRVWTEDYSVSKEEALEKVVEQCE